MQARIAFAVVAIPTALGIVWFGGWALVALLTAAGVLGTRELFAFARQRGVEPSPALGPRRRRNGRAADLAGIEPSRGVRRCRRLVALRRRRLDPGGARLGHGARGPPTRIRSAPPPSP